MEIFKDVDIQVDEKEILRLLGYKDKDADEEIVDTVREEIEGSKEYIDPRVAYERFNIKAITDNNVVLENDIVLEGEFIAGKLKNCSYVIACISTLGGKVDEKIKEAFDSGDFLRGMIIDNIGTTAVGYLNKNFWNKIVGELEGTNIGITSKLSPGDTAWEVSQQRTIFNCVSGERIGVQLTESSMMIPFKSTSAVYGFGEGIGIARLDHICTECSMQHCAYRMDKKIPLTILKNDSRDIVDVEKGKVLLDVLREKGVFVKSPCSGKGICGKCKVQVNRGAGEPTVTDKRHLSEEELEKGVRLSCSIKMDKPMEISLIDESEEIKVLTGGDEIVVKVEPAVTVKHCVMEKPKLEDQRDDIRRLADSCGIDKLKIRFSELAEASNILNASGFDVTAALCGDRLLHLETGDASMKNFGVAVDIGTTTVACYLIDLNTGKTLDVESQVNRQRAYGADVISRINYTMENEKGLQILRDSIVKQLNELIGILCVKNGISENNIYDVTIVGNTTMIHLLLGLPCKNIAMAPYIPVTTDALEYDAREIGLSTKGIVSILPGIASYVGSDITAGIMSSGMLDSDKYSLLLDLGTNGEIALGNKDGVITCSTAAGPAFEGANIKHGIGGIKGAISKVDLAKNKIYETIGGVKPCGICGSGVLDMVAQLVKHGIVDETGRMVEEDEIEDERLQKRFQEEDIKQFVLEEKGADGNPIIFTQKDVREVQLAKAAVRAGINILLNQKGLQYNDIDKVYIGGGFGNYMDIESSLAIGMLPEEFRGKIKSIGNCAGSGARMYLLSKAVRKDTVEIVDKARYIELSSRPDFQDHFIDSMMFE